MIYALAMHEIASTSTTSSQTRLSRSAVRLLRAEVLLSDKSMIQIAQALGVDRQTVGRRLSRDSMPLDAFVGIAQAVGADPGALLAEAERDEMSSVDTGVMPNNKRSTNVS